MGEIKKSERYTWRQNEREMMMMMICILLKFIIEFIKAEASVCSSNGVILMLKAVNVNFDYSQRKIMQKYSDIEKSGKIQFIWGCDVDKQIQVIQWKIVE